MKVGVLLFVTVLASCVPSAASAAGIALGWQNCYADGGVRNRTFACAGNTGSNVVAGSFILDSGLSRVTDTEVVVEIGSGAETLPEWWQFMNAGACRKLSLSIAALDGAGCPDMFALQASMNIAAYQVGVLGPNTARILSVNAVQQAGIVDLSPGQEYGAFRLTINNAKSVGTGSCGGCEVPACISFASLKIWQEGGSSVTLTDPAYESDSKYLSWQANPGPLPVPSPVCAGFDSGGFAVNTNVLGRGSVVRSRTKPKYPEGSPLTLIAAPLAGDRFVAWSGDTTSTEDTLAIVVTRELSYFATFERDPAASPALLSVVDVPNDQGAHVLATWGRSPIDDAPNAGMLCCYRLERTLSSAPGAPWVAASGSIAANFSTTYSQDVTTPADSVEGNSAQLRYRVISIASGNSGEWMSNEMVGYSVDNIAPPPLTSVSGVFASGIATLFWPAVMVPDFDHYAIYRGLEPLPPSDVGHLVGTTALTNFSDNAGHFANYQVAVVDRHGNQSVATPFVPLNTADVGDRAMPSSLTVGRPSPSPMRRNVSIVLGLPRAMRATVDVMDSQGRLVRRLCDGERQAGWVTVSWDARDSRGSQSSAGVYFLRVQTPDGVTSRRLALVP